MYAPTYSYGQGPNNAQQQAGFNPNAPSAAQPAPVPQYFPGQQPQQQYQHQQQMMYNSQQYGVGGSAGPQQNPYAGMGVNPAMMQGSGGMAHMAVNNGVVQGYQTPYSSSPYNTGMPNSTGAMPMQQQFMTPTSNNTQFAMNASSITPQQQQQRMPHSQVSTPIPNSQRVSPYGGAPHNTPPQAQAQSQFMTPQNPSSNQPHQLHTPLQTHNNNPSQTQQPQGQNTPQTPSFPPSSAGATGPSTAIQTPLSPASENREKERVSLLLDINRELLIEVMRLQALQAEAKKENAAATTDTKDGDSKPLEKPSAATTGKDFVECMRRLQANLAYLAAIADRSHKPSSQIPPHPTIISAPPLSPLPPKSKIKQSPKTSPNQNPNIKLESSLSSEAANGASSSTPLSLDATGSEDTEDRLETIKALYARLQALFPGVDPKKEPPIPAMNKSAQQKGQAQKQNSNPGQNQMPGQGQGAGMVGGAKSQQQPQGQMMAGNMTSQGP